MRYSIEVTPRARRELFKLPGNVSRRVEDAISALADDPRPAGARTLTGEGDLYRVRVGGYRVVYSVQDDVLLVLVVKVGHRRDVYRRR